MNKATKRQIGDFIDSLGHTSHYSGLVRTFFVYGDNVQEVIRQAREKFPDTAMLFQEGKDPAKVGMVPATT